MVAKKDGETWFAGSSCFVLCMPCLLPNCCAWYCLPTPWKHQKKNATMRNGALLPTGAAFVCKCKEDMSTTCMWSGCSGVSPFLPVHNRCDLFVLPLSCQSSWEVWFWWMSSIVSPFGHKSVQALSDFTIADRLRYSLSLAALLVTLWTQPFLSFFFFCNGVDSGHSCRAKKAFAALGISCHM